MSDDDNKNSFGVEMSTKESKDKGGSLTLQPESVFAHLDADGDGIITDEEMARAKEIAEFEHTKKRHENEGHTYRGR